MTVARAERPPRPDDFAPPPTATDRSRWARADRAARPERLARLRERLAVAGLDAYFGVRSEHSRYLTGFALGDGEDRVSGSSGWFVVGADEVVLFADSRYRIQAEREAPDARVEPVYGDLEERWPDLLASVGARRVAAEGATSATRRGRSWPPLRPMSSSSSSRAGSRRIGRSRSRASSSGSPPPVRWPTGRWPRSCRRSGLARPSVSSPSGSSG